MFYNSNEIRAYPVDELATGVADSGQMIPKSLLSDLSLAMPRSLSNRAYISAVSRTATQTFVSIAAADANRTPLAMAAWSKYDTPRKAYRLQSLRPDVGGVFVPGEWLGDETYNLRFTTPSQSLLLARVVFATSPIAERDYAVYYSQRALQGVVEVSAQGEIEALVGTRVLNGQERKALILRLRETGLTGNDALLQYAAAQPRPEARTCGDPAPIETINEVRPDCCGRLFIELRGCAQPVAIQNASGVVLDCPQAVEDLCPPKTNFDPGIEQQTDSCNDAGYPDPLDPPSNQPVSPPSWSP